MYVLFFIATPRRLHCITPPSTFNQNKIAILTDKLKKRHAKEKAPQKVHILVYWGAIDQENLEVSGTLLQSG